MDAETRGSRRSMRRTPKRGKIEANGFTAYVLPSSARSRCHSHVLIQRNKSSALTKIPRDLAGMSDTFGSTNPNLHKRVVNKSDNSVFETTLVGGEGGLCRLRSVYIDRLSCIS